MISLSSRFHPYRKFQQRPYLIVDWLTTGVVLTEVTPASGVKSNGPSLYHEWPAGLNPVGQPEETGRWLQSIAGQNKHLPAAAISVARRDLSVKFLELPNVSDDELGPLVALQVESRIQTTGQPITWDALPHPVEQGATHRYVTLVTMPQSTSDAIQAAAKVAGWTTCVLTSGDLLQSNLVQNTTLWQLFVQANRTKLEIVLCHQSVPLASFATGMPGNGVTAQGAEAAAVIIQSMAQRLLAGAPKHWQQEAHNAGVYLSGLYTNEIARQLQVLGIKAVVLAEDERSSRANAIAASLTGNASQRLDFLRPRNTDGHALSRRKRWMRIGAITAGTATAAMAGLWMWKHSLESELARLETERTQLQQYVDRGQRVLDRWDYVVQWQNETVRATDEIRNIAAKIPSRERMLITRLQLDNVVDSEARTLRIEGLAQSPDDVLQMNAEMLKQPNRYDVRPQGIEPSPEGSSLPSQFRIEAVLKGRAATNEPTPSSSSVSSDPTDVSPATEEL